MSRVREGRAAWVEVREGAGGWKREAIDLSTGATQPDFCLTEPFCQLCIE